MRRSSRSELHLLELTDIDEGQDVFAQSSWQGSTADERADLDVVVDGAFGQVGTCDERTRSVGDNDLRVKHGPRVQSQLERVLHVPFLRHFVGLAATKAARSERRHVKGERIVANAPGFFKKGAIGIIRSLSEK